jgi:hypothetical protein
MKRGFIQTSKCIQAIPLSVGTETAQTQERLRDHMLQTDYELYLSTYTYMYTRVIKVALNNGSAWKEREEGGGSNRSAIF